MQQSWFFLCRFSSVGQSIRLITGRAQVQALQATPQRQKKGGFPMELYNGDCLEVMKNIPDDSVNLVLTDPPYNIAVKTTRGG